MFRNFLTLCFLTTSFGVSAFEFSHLIDPGGKLFELSTDEFRSDSAFSRFRWTTDKENEARYFNNGSSSGLTIFGKLSPEVNVRFKKDLFDNALIYIYNRADCPLIQDEKTFDSLVDSMVANVDRWSNVKSSRTARTRAGGSQEYSKYWIYGPYSIEMKWSSSGKGRSYVGNYPNMFVSRYVKGRKKNAVSAKTLPANVVKNEDGDVYIDNIPMVDQGLKGYCAVAAAARVFRYYGHETDMHRLANLAGTTERGTMTADMFNKMRRLSTVYHTKMVELNKFKVSSFVSDIKKFNSFLKRESMPAVQLRVSSISDIYAQINPAMYKEFKRTNQKTNFKRFMGHIHKYVDAGVPEMWGVYLGLYREPELNPQASGPHLRLIIGYNDKTNQIIFSDTWGRKHYLKHLDAAEAWAQTNMYAVLLTR